MAKNELQKQGRIVMLPVDCIEPSPYQARTAFDEPEIAALAVSILQNGLLQPISVRRVGLRKYQLIAGERRLRACRLAKLEKVPAILADRWRSGIFPAHTGQCSGQRRCLPPARWRLLHGHPC